MAWCRPDWDIVYLPHINKIQWKFHRNSYIFCQENPFGNVWKMADTLSRPQCVNRGCSDSVIFPIKVKYSYIICKSTGTRPRKTPKSVYVFLGMYCVVLTWSNAIHYNEVTAVSIKSQRTLVIFIKLFRLTTHNISKLRITAPLWSIDPL